MKSSTMLMVASATAVFGLAYNAPRATPVIDDTASLAQGWTPKPTSKYDLGHELLKRQAQLQTVLVAPDNTCGFISGRAGAAFYCSATYSCNFIKISTQGVSTGAVACCDDDSCGFRQTCIDSVQFYSSSACDNGCQRDKYTAKCTESTRQYCQSITFPNEGVQDYYCGSISFSSWQTAWTTYAGMNPPRSFSTQMLNLDTSASSIASSARSSLVRSSSSITSVSSVSSISESVDPFRIISSIESTTPPGPTPTTPTPTPEPDDKAPIGAIVGGVVGGLAVLAAAVGGCIFLLIRRKRRNNNDASFATPSAPAPAPAPAPQGQTGYFPPPMQQSPQPQYQQPYQQPYQYQPYQPPPPVGAAEVKQPIYTQISPTSQPMTPATDYYNPPAPSPPQSPPPQSHLSLSEAAGHPAPQYVEMPGQDIQRPPQH